MGRVGGWGAGGEVGGAEAGGEGDVWKGFALPVSLGLLEFKSDVSLPPSSFHSASLQYITPVHTHTPVHHVSTQTQTQT